jgi:hypothetical protein
MYIWSPTTEEYERCSAVVYDFGGGETHMTSLLQGQNLSAYPLRQALFDVYGSPDRRVKNIEKITRFRVDACQLAKGADGNPLSSVCTIWATVESESKLNLHLSGSIPLDGAVKEWIDSVGNGASIGQNALSLSLKLGNQDRLSGLATAMRARAGSRQTYTYASHGHSAREIADGLEHLRKVLDTVWK